MSGSNFVSRITKSLSSEFPQPIISPLLFNHDATEQGQPTVCEGHVSDRRMRTLSLGYFNSSFQTANVVILSDHFAAAPRERMRTPISLSDSSSHIIWPVRYRLGRVRLRSWWRIATMILRQGNPARHWCGIAQGGRVEILGYELLTRLDGKLRVVQDSAMRSSQASTCPFKARERSSSCDDKADGWQSPLSSTTRMCVSSVQRRLPCGPSSMQLWCKPA